MADSYADYFLEIETKNNTITAHPLIDILIKPVLFLIKGVVLDSKMALIIFKTILATSMSYFCFLIIKKLSNSNLLATVLSAIYGFSFSMIIFIAYPETYLFSGFFITLFWLYTVYLIVDPPPKLNWINYFTLSFLLVLPIGIELSNMIFSFISLVGLSLVLFKKRFKSFIIILMCSAIILTLLTYLQKFSFLYTETVFKILKEMYIHPENTTLSFLDPSISLSKLHQVYSQMFYYIFVSAPINTYLMDINIPLFSFNNAPKPYNIIFPIFYLIPTILFFINFKSNKYRGLMGLISILILTSFVCCYFFGFGEVFLYTQNFLIFLILFITIGLVGNRIINKIVICLYIPFLMWQIPVNYSNFLLIIKNIKSHSLDFKYPDINFYFIALFLTFTIFLFTFFARKIISPKILNMNTLDKISLGVGIYFIYTIVYMFLLSINMWRFILE